MENNNTNFEGKSLQIYFIRHAESENNALQAKDRENYKTVRLQDPKLTKRGFVQTEACVSYLKKKGIKPTKVFCSLNSRALQTADVFQKHFSCDVETKRDFCEQGFVYNWRNGEVVSEKGPGRSELEKLWPKFKIDEVVKENGWNENVGAETKEQLNARADRLLDFVKDLVKDTIEQGEENSQQYVIVSHGLFLDSILGQIFQRKEGSLYKFNTKMQNTSISCFDITYSGNFNMKYINDYNHLLDWCIDQDIKEKAELVGGINPEIKVTQMK